MIRRIIYDDTVNTVLLHFVFILSFFLLCIFNPTDKRALEGGESIYNSLECLLLQHSPVGTYWKKGMFCSMKAESKRL
jgi:hypothetical protein